MSRTISEGTWQRPMAADYVTKDKTIQTIRSWEKRGDKDWNLAMGAPSLTVIAKDDNTRLLFSGGVRSVSAVSRITCTLGTTSTFHPIDLSKEAQERVLIRSHRV